MRGNLELVLSGALEQIERRVARADFDAACWLVATALFASAARYDARVDRELVRLRLSAALAELERLPLA
jgi:type IV secretory pathway TrbD component